MDDYDRWDQVTALICAWLAAPELDADVRSVAFGYHWSDQDAARLTRGLVDGYAYELDCLEANANVMIRRGEALQRLIAHVKATNRRALRRARAQSRP